jgi:hypothetical protein
MLLRAANNKNKPLSQPQQQLETSLCCLLTLVRAMFAIKFVTGFANDRIHEVSSAACHTAAAVTAPIGSAVGAALGAASVVYDAVQAITATAGLAEPAGFSLSSSPSKFTATGDGLSTSVPHRLSHTAAITAEAANEGLATAPATPVLAALLPLRPVLSRVPLPPVAFHMTASSATLLPAGRTAAFRSKSHSPKRASPKPAAQRVSRTPIYSSR